MSHMYLVPQWFFGFDVFFELIFAFTAAFVAWYSFKIYKLSEQRSSMLFGTGFLFISLSYFIKAIINYLIIRQVQEGILGITLENLNNLGTIGVYTHIALFMFGLATIVYVTCNVKSRRIYLLFITIAISILFVGCDKIVTFNLFSSIFLFFIAGHYALEYRKNKNNRTLILLIAFTCIFLSGLTFLVYDNYYNNYVISHFLELFGYIFIIISLFLTVRKK